MGGDCFEGVEKLTNEEYEALVPEILAALEDLYVRGEPYIPLPEKTVHGDMDFLMILKPGVKPKDIVQTLKIERFILNNNETINTVYKNKQVDFCFKTNDADYEIAKFYKSYSGMGAHLGLFLPSKEIKLADTGLFAISHKQHIKYELLLTNSVEQILKFYGLDYETYAKGFKTRKELFDYLRGCHFMDEKATAEYESKNRTKLTKFFIEYLKDQVKDLHDKKKIEVEQPLKYALEYFKKQQQFKKGFETLLEEIERKQTLNKKFNGMHIMDYFKVETKKVNKIKERFRAKFENGEDYFKYIENHSLEEILKKMEQQLDIKPPKEEKNHEDNLTQTENEKCIKE